MSSSSSVPGRVGREGGVWEVATGTGVGVGGYPLDSEMESTGVVWLRERESQSGEFSCSGG